MIILIHSGQKQGVGQAKNDYGKQVDIENSTKCISIATDFNDFETFIDTIRK